ncbi:MAG: APC family permease [Anaerolineales bacterium]|nr:APC family permease [Anaerolineales bacterium]MDW8162750.1 APC family permease [Anaerolineales bacterium]
MSEVTLFVRRASGLVRAWSTFDAFIYATFSINLITLGLYIFSYCYYFEGNLATAVVIGGVFTIFEVIVYASLISAMPRAGGDYVWQSRILGRGIGFLLAVTGWWFILWLWVPLYGQMLVYTTITPALAILGAREAALWFTNTSSGLLVGCLAVCLIVFIYIAVGMKWYARVQKFCFFGGMLGLLVVFLLLLFGNQQTFIANLNTFAARYFGASGQDLYQATLAAGEAAGTVAAPLSNFAVGASMALIPMIVFFNLWPNWGSTLYGEVRGANDYKRNFWGMASAVIVTAILALIFFALIHKSIGWEFYHKANGAFWNYTWGYTQEAPPLPFWPYPVLFAAFMSQSPVVHFVVVLLMSLWWFGWSGTVFLSSTRVIFAAAFDRMLPEWVSAVEPRTRTPINALLLMVIPSVVISILYSFNIWNFRSLALDATLVIAVTFLGTTVAAIVLPWRQKEIFEGSPIAQYKTPPALGWLVLILYAIAAAYLIITSFSYMQSVLGGLAAIGAEAITWFSVVIVSVLTIVNAVLLLWILYYVGSRAFKGELLPVVTTSGLVFLAFLDWLLVEWFWDPHVPPFDFPLYAIGWSNASSMLFMLFNYLLAGAIYVGFNLYRRRQGIDVDKVYKEIPVE